MLSFECCPGRAYNRIGESGSTRNLNFYGTMIIHLSMNSTVHLGKDRYSTDFRNSGPLFVDFTTFHDFCLGNARP